MPQVWLSYAELGAHLRCSPEKARENVGRSGWSRRRCSDGLTRVKLPPVVMSEYVREILTRMIVGCAQQLGETDTSGASDDARGRRHLDGYDSLFQ